METAKSIGMEAYNVRQTEKVRLLTKLLEKYNSGREKTLFCLAVNLLEIDDIVSVLKAASERFGDTDAPVKEKAVFVSEQLHALAQRKNAVLKLRKKT